ncbi:hypothetical protein [Desertibaculum subflavum]|uniref:hypothetical protein n=1 Tax=Desertibaculum subflavum TaxID=2268458 RepID=UPI000E675F02
MELVRRTTRWVVDFWGHLGTFVKVAGTATALIGIAVTVTQTYDAVSAHFARREAVRDLVAVAERQLQGGDHAAAWSSNLRALELIPRDETAERQQIVIAKLWLQEARLSSQGGPKSFAQLVGPLEEVLLARSLKAEPADRAEIEAHIAWARFLRSRDASGAPIDVDGAIDAALKSDPQNATAHAIKGFWLLWRRGPLAEVRRHFDAALAGRGDQGFADHLVMKGWLNQARSGEDYAYGAIEYANRLHRRGRSFDDATIRGDLLAIYEEALRSRGFLDRLAGVLVPTDHADLLASLGGQTGNDERRRHAEALRGYFVERSGNRAEARRIYQHMINTAPDASRARAFAAEGLLRLRD